MRSHMIFPRIGHVHSPAAVCMVVAASSPGARKSIYGTPPTPPEPRFTRPPSPRPIAAKKKRGVKNDRVVEPRHTRLKTAALCSTTRTAPAAEVTAGGLGERF